MIESSQFLPPKSILCGDKLELEGNTCIADGTTESPFLLSRDVAISTEGL